MQVRGPRGGGEVAWGHSAVECLVGQSGEAEYFAAAHVGDPLVLLYAIKTQAGQLVPQGE